MRAAAVFPGKYVNANDLQGRDVIVTIDKIVMQPVGDDETKPVCYFVGRTKGLILNRTNWSTLEEITGFDDSDQWPGTRILLKTVKVEFQGKRVPGIRLDAAPQASQAPAPRPSAAAPAPTTLKQARQNLRPAPVEEPPVEDDFPVTAPDDDLIPF